MRPIFRGVDYISTHTPREGRDISRRNSFCAAVNFNSHAPRGARRTCRRQQESWKRFQLTRPARGATVEEFAAYKVKIISTHTPREGRDKRIIIAVVDVFNFNSHAPRGARPKSRSTAHIAFLFQLTRPARGATDTCYHVNRVSEISTHTPREGRDRCKVGVCIGQNHFNSHAPRGARQPIGFFSSSQTVFQLTRPARGATIFAEIKTCSASEFQLTRPARGATLLRAD